MRAGRSREVVGRVAGPVAATIQPTLQATLLPRLLSALLLAPVLAPVAYAGPGSPAPFTVTGRFLYEDKAWGESGWTGLRPELPVRGADVTVLDATAQRVLGRGLTDADGDFAVACASQAAFADVLVRVETRNRQHGAAEPFTAIGVVDTENQPYAAFAPVAAGHDTAADLDTGTTVALAVWLPEGDGNPFNIFDQAVAAWEHVTGPHVGAPQRSRGIRLHWPSATGSWASGRHAWIAGDDGYDDAVILHEIGHVVHNLYSDSDNPGGIHYFGDSDQDPRLSFSEGYATFLAGSVLLASGREALYVDCDGDAAAGGVQLRLALETAAPYAATVAGACDEIAVACTLFDLLDDEGSSDDTPGIDDDGFQAGAQVGGMPVGRAFWKVFTGPVRTASRATIDDLWDGWQQLHAPAAADGPLQPLFDANALRFWNDAAEPDDTPADASPLVAEASGPWSAEHTLYRSDDPGQRDGTGDRDWFAVPLCSGQVVRIETRYPDGASDARTQADPFLSLHGPGGARVATDDNSGTGRNARIDAFTVPETGTWSFSVRSRNPLARYGRYEVRVVLLAG